MIMKLLVALVPHVVDFLLAKISSYFLHRIGKTRVVHLQKVMILASKTGHQGNQKLHDHVKVMKLVY